MDTIEHDGVTWVNVTSPDSHTLAKLGETYNLHPVHLQESIQKVQHNQVEAEKGYFFLVMHYPVIGSRKGKLTTGQLGIFLGKDYVITISNGHAAAVMGLFDEMKREERPAAFRHGAAYVLYGIITRLLAELSVMTDAVADELDALEGSVFDNAVSDAQRIGTARQKIVKLMRLIGPKKIILQDLAEQVAPTVSHDTAKAYLNTVKSASRLFEAIEESKETVEIYKDADFTTSTERTNETLAVLTIIFTLSIPATLVGALYGMNVPLPGGLDTGPWTFWGQYTTLIVVLAVSVLAAVGMYAYFKAKKWF